MKILIIDLMKTSVAFAMRCMDAGHQVRVWMPLEKGKASKIGNGIVEKVKDWKGSMNWADLIITTDNNSHGKELEPYFKKGYPIFGCNQAGAQWELDREKGQEIFESVGIKTLQYEVFQSFDKAIAYVMKENKPFVAKPWGGNPDKSLSYVPKTAEDLVSMLQSWKRQGIKGEFLLQEMIEGQEMAVGSWFGPGGFSKWINENWEEKRLMNGGLGPNTGEMGTVMRYVKQSKLFDIVLKPLEEKLQEIGYVGYVDVNCMIDQKGIPWPLEFTMRFGEPHFQLCQALHKGDPAQWMLDLLDGRDTLDCETDICIGVVMAMGDYPWEKWPAEKVEGYPIRGLTSKNMQSIFMSGVMIGEAPVSLRGKIREQETFVTAAEYVLIVTGLGPTIVDAQESVYDTVEKINWPPHRIYRTDIGDRMEDDLPKLQKQGYAVKMEFE